MMLSEDINGKICQLERAIKQLDAVKRHLLHNATEIKGQVQTTMSRHLEALRNREVWLLNQVDLVFSAKESVLQAQQGRLNKMLGVLQSAIGLTSDSDMDTILNDTLQKMDVDINDLNPEETAFFSFRADPADLRKSILNYGHVDANGMPLMGAFFEPESQTLPRHFEDYEGPDHHIFHKTVEDNMKSSERGIYVNIPKLSTKSEDWLLRPTTVTTNTETTPRFSFPAFSSNSFDWTQKKSPMTSAMESPPLRTISSDASIKDWLCQIKHYSDGEEDDFEIVDNPGFTSAASTCSTETSAKPVVGNLDLVNIANMKFPKAVQNWLRSNRSTPEEKPQSDVLQYFQHIPSDPNHWLLNGTEKKKSCEECISTGPSDIETLGDRLGSLTCTPVMSNFFKSCPTDKRCWLKTAEDIKSAMPDVKTVCRANELCEGYEECVCKPHCGFQHLGFEDTDHWLIKTEKGDLEDLKEKCPNNTSCNMASWLSPTKPVEFTNTQISFSFFQEASKEIKDWLKESEKKYEGDLDFKSIFKFKDEGGDGEKWLKSSQEMEVDDEEDSATWNVVKDQHSKLNSADWLLKTTFGQSHQRDNKGYWLLSSK
ncbi:hypothetical protein SNE40_020239 [Patella caerulea]|uniref:Nuclear receptor coactivator 4 N-terminal domain-containing protein n=2 Tax=Patella caerulea TaxID=87958 RepID=A0AAN8IZH5_PATCE